MSEDVKARLEAYYRRADKDFQISDLKPISDGWETEVYSFTLKLRHQTEQMILRMYPGADAAAKCEREYEGLYGGSANRYPVLLVTRHETDPEWLGKPFIIMQKIDGRPLGELMREDTARQSELLSRFVQLFVDLHRSYDYHTYHYAWLNRYPAIYTPATLENRRKAILDHFGQTWAAPIFDWLDAYEVKEAPALSPLHGDFHPYNVLITPDDQLYVIDWSGFSVGDYRYDLAWTLLLVSTSGYPQLRDLILSEYARLAGKPVEQLEYFDVLASLRRLVDFSVSLGSGAEATGMRPETAAIMRERGDHYRQVYALLQNRTGLQIPEIEQLLDSLST